jgi:hypothetical protein
MPHEGDREIQGVCDLWGEACLPDELLCQKPVTVITDEVSPAHEASGFLSHEHPSRPVLFPAGTGALDRFSRDGIRIPGLV